MVLALATALFTATIALLGKMGFDSWARYRNRQGIAASLAGEIEMYLSFIARPDVAATLRLICDAGPEQRQNALRGFGRLPDSHPVFDKVADQVGLLSIELAYDISRLYNVVTGVRLLMSDLSTERVIGLQDAQQVALVRQIIGVIEEYSPIGRTVALRLKQIAHQPYRCYLLGCKSTGQFELNGS